MRRGRIAVDVVAADAMAEAAARAHLVEHGYAVLPNVVTNVDVLRDAARASLERFCGALDALTPATADSALNVFGFGAPTGRVDVYHSAAQNSARESALAALFERVTGVAVRWMLYESYVLRLSDALTNVQRSLAPPPLMTYERAAERQIYDAPYHAYLALTDDTAGDDGAFEVISRTALRGGDDASKFIRDDAPCFPNASGRVCNDRSFWTSAYSGQRAADDRAAYVRRVPLTAGSLLVVASDTKHTVCERTLSHSRYKLVMPLTWLPDSALNAQWIARRQYASFILGSSPFLGPSIETVESRVLRPSRAVYAHQLPFEYTPDGAHWAGVIP
jgi:hypothetical protein